MHTQIRNESVKWPPHKRGMYERCDLGNHKSASLFQQSVIPTLTPTNDYNTKNRLAPICF